MYTIHKERHALHVVKILNIRDNKDVKKLIKILSQIILNRGKKTRDKTALYMYPNNYTLLLVMTCTVHKFLCISRGYEVRCIKIKPVKIGTAVHSNSTNVCIQGN